MQKFHQFLAQLERGPRPAYVLAGAEGLLRSEAEAAIVRAVFGDKEPGAGFVPIDCLGTGGVPVEPADVLDELRSVSLFSDRKVVAARRADALVKGHRDAFLDYLAHPDPDAILVIHILNWDKRTATARKLDPYAVDCTTPYETGFGESVFSPGSPLGRWIAERAPRAHGLRLSADAARRLVELVGTNLGEIDGALEALALSLGNERGAAGASGVASTALDDAPLSRRDTGPGSPHETGGSSSAALLTRGAAVSWETVDRNVAPSRSYTQFKVAELVAKGRAGEAFAAADACFVQGMPGAKGRVDHNDGTVATRLIWSIGREFEMLYAARGLIEEGTSVRAGAGKLGIQPWKADAVERAARAVALETLARGMELAFEADWAVKRGDAEPRFAVERLILELGKLLTGERAAVER